MFFPIFGSKTRRLTSSRLVGAAAAWSLVYKGYRTLQRLHSVKVKNNDFPGSDQAE